MGWRLGDGSKPIWNLAKIVTNLQAMHKTMKAELRILQSMTKIPYSISCISRPMWINNIHLYISSYNIFLKKINQIHQIPRPKIFVWFWFSQNEQANHFARVSLLFGTAEAHQSNLQSFCNHALRGWWGFAFTCEHQSHAPSGINTSQTQEVSETRRRTEKWQTTNPERGERGGRDGENAIGN